MSGSTLTRLSLRAPIHGPTTRPPGRASALSLLWLLALAALLFAPRADALLARPDHSATTAIVPAIELSAGSWLQATVSDGTVTLSGHVERPLEHFLARRAVAARHGSTMPIVDTVTVLSPPIRRTGSASTSGACAAMIEAPDRIGNEL